MLKDHPIIKAYQEHNEFGKLLHMDFEIQAPGEVLYFLQVDKIHLATHKAAHGGLAAALLDAALGVAALSKVVAFNKVVSTVTLNLTYIKPVLLGDQLVAKAKVTQNGSRIFFAEGEIYNQKDEVVAKANGVFNAYPMEKAGY